VTVILSTLLDSGEGIVNGMSTRLGGVSPPPFGMNLSFHVGDAEEYVHENRRRFFGTLGISLDRLAFPLQVHGDRILTVESPGEYADCDALMTRTPDLYLCVTVADCVPILVVDTVGQGVAAIHSGWRGTAQHITLKVVERMKEEWGSKPEHCAAFIGASAGSCCYEVGNNVASRFPKEFLASGKGNTHLDLKRATVAQLVQAGIPKARIEIDPSCTICEPHRFHSFRRDGKCTGRMMAVIGIRARIH